MERSGWPTPTWTAPGHVRDAPVGITGVGAMPMARLGDLTVARPDGAAWCFGRIARPGAATRAGARALVSVDVRVCRPGPGGAGCAYGGASIARRDDGDWTA